MRLGSSETLRGRVGRWIGAGLRLIYPPGCALCGAALADATGQPFFCAPCLRGLVRPRGTLCPRCGAVVRAVLIGPDGCPRCRQRRLRFETVVSLGVYEGPLRQALLRMKKPAGEPLSVALGHLLAQQIGRQLAQIAPDVLVPIPMHWTRRLVRGTNSPELLAAVLARRMGVPAERGMLVRRRKTFRQFGLAPAERFRNIRHAFRVAAGYHLEAVHVLLVDDILTTGATCDDAARVLRAAGAERVSVAVVARAEGL